MERLPQRVKEKILTFGEYKMGAHLVDLVLDDGRLAEDVIVAWGDEVISVPGGVPPDFDPRRVVDATDKAN
jgi:hypothetical protein